MLTTASAIRNFRAKLAARPSPWRMSPRTSRSKTSVAKLGSPGWRRSSALRAWKADLSRRSADMNEVAQLTGDADERRLCRPLDRSGWAQFHFSGSLRRSARSLWPYSRKTSSVALGIPGSREHSTEGAESSTRKRPPSTPRTAAHSCLESRRLAQMDLGGSRTSDPGRTRRRRLRRKPEEKATNEVQAPVGSARPCLLQRHLGPPTGLNR